MIGQKYAYTIASAVMLAGGGAPAVATFAVTDTSTVNSSQQVVSKVATNASVNADISTTLVSTTFMDSLFAKSNLSKDEQNALVTELVTYLRSIPQTRGRYYKSSTTISAAKVKKIIGSSNPVK